MREGATTSIDYHDGKQIVTIVDDKFDFEKPDDIVLFSKIAAVIKKPDLIDQKPEVAKLVYEGIYTKLHPHTSLDFTPEAAAKLLKPMLKENIYMISER